MLISERLQMVIKMNGMTNASFADKIGVQRSSISHVLAGRNKPSIDFIQKILVTFPKVNADWLVTGKKIGKTAESEEKALAPSTSVEPEVVEAIETVKQEDRAGYRTSISKRDGSTIDSRSSSDKKISKIVVFYDDGTFEETVSKH